MSTEPPSGVSGFLTAVVAVSFFGAEATVSSVLTGGLTATSVVDAGAGSTSFDVGTTTGAVATGAESATTGTLTVPVS